jgi:hypothetical protein
MGTASRTFLGAIFLALATVSTASAGDEDRRFLKFPNGNATTTYDLNTVQIIQPGRFTIVSTTMNSPDVMKFELGALDTLQTYCAHADGKYPAPENVLTLGPPDMPVQSIDVGSNPTSHAKRILWFYPYKKLAVSMGHGLLEQAMTILSCNLGSEKEDRSYFWQARAMITDGSQQKYLYDCKRGLMGFFLDDKKDALTDFVPKGTRAFEQYLSVCRAVTHEAPYVPN